MAGPGKSDAALSRRGFLRTAGLGTAAVALGGPALLAACSRAPSAGRTVRVVNQPLAIDDNTQAIYERQSGIFLDYAEYTDPAAYLRQHASALRAHRDIGSDVLVLPDLQTAQMIVAGWVQPLSLPAATRGRAIAQFADPAFDRGRRFSLPWASTMVGLAYDRRSVRTPLRSAGALFDPHFAGRVVFAADPGSTLGLTMLASGRDPAKVTGAQADAAATRVAAAVASGQIRSFATTEYVDDLLSGRARLAIGRADDIRDAAILQPTLTFVVPTEGGLLSSTNMVVPVGAQNVDEAFEFVDYMFAPDPTSRLSSFANLVAPVTGSAHSLAHIDPKAAADPLVVPDPSVWARLSIWGGTTATARAEDRIATLASAHSG